jgi:hypothetical protein
LTDYLHFYILNKARREFFHFTDAGAALLNMLNGIADNGAANPYLIKLGPGIYDLGTCDTSGNPPFSCVLCMKEYVDIEGSGEETMKITGAINFSSVPVWAGTVAGSSNAELRFLTVENTSTAANAAAIHISITPSPSILHVTATVTGSDGGVVFNDPAGTLTCVGAYNANYVGLNTSCQ